MYLKYCWLTFVLNANLGNGFGFFDIGNTFHYLNKELRSIAPSRFSDFKTRWIVQDLDNFDPTEKRTWKMRYFVRFSYWRYNGPVYLFLGGESPASPLWTKTGTMYELAKETNGIMYVSEHRYYGKSKPLNTTDVRNFKYLTSRQALADNAKLLRSIKSWPMFNNSKVIVIGGSYSGNLAAWMKLLYPQLVDAVLASSGPVLAKKNFYEYLEKVNDNYEQYGTPNCLDKTRNIFKRYDRLIQSAEGIEQLKEEEDICQECNMTDSKNQQVFFMYKVDEYMSNSQYGNTNTIENHCKRIESGVESRILKRSSKPNFWLEVRKCYCYDFNLMIEEYRDEENDWILTWIYQTCTEFSYFQTSSSESQPFTDNIPLSFYLDTCSALYGDDFDENKVDEGVRNANAFYGGLTPNVTNVVFSNGDLDPWSTLSVLEDVSYNAPAVVIPRTSHCRDLFSNKKDDIEELKDARKYIKNLIKNWITVDNTGSN